MFGRPTHRLVVVASIMALVGVGCSATIDLSIPSSTTTTITTTTATDGTTDTTAGSSTAPDDPSTGTSVAPAAPSYLFTLTEPEIFSVGAEPWEEAFVTAQAIIEQDGVWHMFYTGSKVSAVLEDLTAIGYASSDNGVDFFRVTTDPILEYVDIDYIDNFPRASSVLIDDDGTWMLFFTTSGFEGRRSSSLIARATAPGPLGPWTFDPEPNLVPGERNDWDDLSVANPEVIKVGDEYRMYYDAHTSDRDAKPSRHIGLATSTDGTNWTKYDDPETTEDPFATSDPVFMLSAASEDDWDHFRVYSPTVVVEGNGFTMIYSADRRYENLLERTFEYGVATSPDGVTWTRHPANPVWSTLDTLDDDTPWTSAFAPTAVRTNDRWTIYVTAGQGISLPGRGRALVYEGPLQ